MLGHTNGDGVAGKEEDENRDGRTNVLDCRPRATLGSVELKTTLLKDVPEALRIEQVGLAFAVALAPSAAWTEVPLTDQQAAAAIKRTLNVQLTPESRAMQLRFVVDGARLLIADTSSTQPGTIQFRLEIQ